MNLCLSSVHKNVWLATLVAISILLFGLWILHRVPVPHRDIVATGLLGDMVVTFPVVYYLLVVRPLKLRKWQMMLVFTCSCAVAYAILPAHQRQYILQLRKLSGVVEVGMLVYGFSKIRQLQAEYRRLEAEFPDPAHHLYQSLTTVMGDSWYVKVLASELSIVRFGILALQKQRISAKVLSQYSVYKEAGYAAIFCVFLFVGMIEISAVHLLLMRYSAIAAWIVMALSGYSILFLIGDFSAIVKSPILVLPHKLVLRAGIRWRMVVAMDNIASVEKVSPLAQPDTDAFNGSLMKSATVCIVFKHPVEISRLYGKPLSTQKILMSVDDGGRFVDAVQSLI